jgi:thiol-disulfide isomerase/thioredoxin
MKRKSITMMKHLLAGVLASAVVLTPGVLVNSVAMAEDAPAAAPAKKARLGVGDPAPTLEGIKWLKGEPVSGYQAGQVYVLDMWATWCGPCVASIPHVNEMHTKLKDKGVNVVGIAIWPRKGMKPTKEFVDGKGDKMSYRIAEDVNNQIADSFMKPAGQNGIPSVFVVDQKGKIAWIGHPMDGLDAVVDEVVKGDFDPIAFEKKQAAEAEKAKKFEDAFEAAVGGNDYAKGLVAAEDLIKFDAKKYRQVNVYKYIALVKTGKAADAKAFGAGLVADKESDANMMNYLAWSIVNPEGEFSDTERDADLAVAAASKANDELKGKEPAIMDTLARAYFVKGDLDKAVETQTKAVELAEDEMKEQLTSALEEYKTAQKKKAGG